MNGLANNYLAETMAAERSRNTSSRADRARQLKDAGADHPVRRRFAHSLISMGLKLSPQPLEMGPAPRPAQPC